MWRKRLPIYHAFLSSSGLPVMIPLSLHCMLLYCSCSLNTEFILEGVTMNPPMGTSISTAPAATTGAKNRVPIVMTTCRTRAGMEVAEPKKLRGRIQTAVTVHRTLVAGAEAEVETTIMTVKNRNHTEMAG
ncbi:hypothetical protein K438DRAFT_913393 [Mycena galopus ATCC 62051]|nr:hypothetical protein K438DRAFT_913393 [Mycena galopus ATCC 62051]